MGACIWASCPNKNAQSVHIAEELQKFLRHAFALATLARPGRPMFTNLVDVIPGRDRALVIRMAGEKRIIEPELGRAEEGEVNCRERLGGLLRYYYRDAA